MRLRQKLRPLAAAVIAAVIAALALSCSERGEKAVNAPAAPPGAPELIARADALYLLREDAGRVREAVALLRRARTLDEGDYGAHWKLARSLHFLGETLSDAGERDASYSEGIAAGQQAVRVRPAGVEGHYWLGANLAGRTEVQGVIGDLAAVGDVRREMEAVIAADESFERGGAYLHLARVEMGLPRVLGGDRKRAVELLEKGLKFGPDNAGLRLQLARAFLAARRREDARRELQALIAMEPNPDYVPEHRRAVVEAERLLKERSGEQPQ
jgi:tetratricopeptide (TPR) repeat protein